MLPLPRLTGLPGPSGGWPAVPPGLSIARPRVLVKMKPQNVSKNESGEGGRLDSIQLRCRYQWKAATIPAGIPPPIPTSPSQSHRAGQGQGRESDISGEFRVRVLLGSPDGTNPGTGRIGCQCSEGSWSICGEIQSRFGAGYKLLRRVQQGNWVVTTCYLLPSGRLYPLLDNQRDLCHHAPLLISFAPK
jgi:hypothetical protein